MEMKGYLLLEDGSLYEGSLRGAQKDATAELVFTTAMVGYMETLTDPSYDGQIVVQTFPCIGNYGVIPFDEESPHPRMAGYVVRELCDAPNNFRCTGKLDDYLRAEGVTCLTGVDTRALTRKLRDRGVMNAAILTGKPADMDTALAALRAHSYHPDIQNTTCTEVIQPRTKGLYHVVLWDFGAKANIQRELEKRGCAVTCVPASATCAEIMALEPDGVMLSNGPGDPSDNTGVISELKELCRQGLPVFGICLGHQLLALSQGGQVVKLKYGHRGANQPVKDVKTGLNYITSQNHGFAVDQDHLPDNATVRFINCNDGTCEGLDYTDLLAYSVQFHPEACGGPLDTRFLFDRFIAMMGGNKECR